MLSVTRVVQTRSRQRRRRLRSGECGSRTATESLAVECDSKRRARDDCLFWSLVGCARLSPVPCARLSPASLVPRSSSVAPTSPIPRCIAFPLTSRTLSLSFCPLPASLPRLALSAAFAAFVCTCYVKHHHLLFNCEMSNVQHSKAFLGKTTIVLRW